MAGFVTSRVVLYKNGIGYFERKGVVENDTTIELFFPADAMNDILKSINVTSSKEHKHSITYEVPSASSSSPQSPISTHKELYSRLLRENVTIQTLSAEEVSGMVIAVDYVSSHDSQNNGTISLFTKDNRIQTLLISSINNLQVPNSLITQAKSLKINIKTSHKQEITVSYIRSCPVWKPTYRVILNSSSSSPSEYKLYGWATIHNPGPDDWVGTLVSLVAGQPVSFINEVYKPKYVSRPKLKAEDTRSPLGISNLLVSSLSQNEYDSSSDNDTERERNDRKNKRKTNERELSRSDEDSRSRSRSRSPAQRNNSSSHKEPANDPFTSTSETESSDLFRYDVTNPINLVNGQSALIPIFESVVQGRKVALFNNSLHREHPFSALVLSNSTGLTLEAGSITVFDGDMYIGEAHLIATKPNERRFLPFALELGVFVQNVPINSPIIPVHQVKIGNSSISFWRKVVRMTHYVITNKSEKEIELLLEHAKQYAADPSSVSLIVEECYSGNEKEKNKIEVKTEYVTGKSTGHYGLNFKISPRSTTHLVLSSQSTEVVNDSLRDLSHYRGRITDTVLFSKINKVLQPLWDLENQSSVISHDLKNEKEKLNEYEKSQTRARSNLSAVYNQEKEKQKKYSNQIDEIEDQILASNIKIKRANEDLHLLQRNIKSVSQAIVFDSLQ